MQDTDSDAIKQRMNELLDITYNVLGSNWQDAILALDHDNPDTLCFSVAPAGKGMHHAYVGGLVVHYLEMWGFWKQLKPKLLGSKIITDESVLAGILAHDLHKANGMYKLVDNKIDYANSASACMVSAAHMNIALIPATCRTDLALLNVISCAEGGWAKDPAKWVSSLAKLVYLLDELSANVLARINEHSEFDVRTKDENFNPLR